MGNREERDCNCRKLSSSQYVLTKEVHAVLDFEGS